MDDLHLGIVGGMFGLPLTIADGPNMVVPGFLRGPGLLLTNARSGIRVLIDKLNCGRVWVPSYLCPSIIQSIDRSRVDVAYYPVNATLHVATDSWLLSVHEGDLVMFIDYFGFPAEESLAAEAKRRGAWVLEDASQALLTSVNLDSADFILYSPRKFVGVPDGGILIATSGQDISVPAMEPPPDSWWLCSLEAAIRRRELDKYHVENGWFDWYLKSKKASPAGPYRMSELSKRLLLSAFNYDVVASRRIRNYRLLLAGLADIAVFGDLPSGVVPLGFPVRVRNRDVIKKAMYDRQIYPPVHWEIREVVPEEYKESLALSQCVLTLLCDQRYDEYEMTAMIDILRNHWIDC